MSVSRVDDRFRITSGRSALMVRHYPPAADDFSRAGVVLVHGLLSSSDAFDVPGLEATSLARRLQRAGLRVVSYDQRGAGESTADDWHFGLREHALVDLPAILRACRERLGLDRVVLLGHSLGGTIWLRYLTARTQRDAAGTAADDGQPSVVAGVAIASPATFNRQDPPWSGFASRGRAFVESIDRDHDGIVTREEFVAAQAALHWPWAQSLFHPAAARAVLDAAGRSRLVAGLLMRLPIRTLAHYCAAFDDRALQCVLRSKTLDRGSHALLLELLDEILTAQGERPDQTDSLEPVAIDALCIGSAGDRFVPFSAVHAFSRRCTTAHVIATEAAFGSPSSHMGYLFKRGLSEQVSDAVARYVRKVLDNGR
jgi:pimeloyl-ACP methyl ester carboxylesterase